MGVLVCQCVCRCMQRPEDNIRSFEARVKCDPEKPVMGNRMWFYERAASTRNHYVNPSVPISLICELSLGILHFTKKNLYFSQSLVIITYII